MQRVDAQMLQDLLNRGCTFRFYDRISGELVETLCPDSDVRLSESPDQEQTSIIFRPVGFWMHAGRLDWARPRHFAVEWLEDAPAAPEGGLAFAGLRYTLVITPGVPANVDWSGWVADKERLLTEELCEAWLRQLDELQEQV